MNKEKCSKTKKKDVMNKQNSTKYFSPLCVANLRNVHNQQKLIPYLSVLLKLSAVSEGEQLQTTAKICQDKSKKKG